MANAYSEPPPLRSFWKTLFLFLSLSLPPEALAETPKKGAVNGKQYAWDCKISVTAEELCSPVGKLDLKKDAAAANLKKQCLAHFEGALSAVTRICKLSENAPAELEKEVKAAEARMTAKNIAGPLLAQRMANATYILEKNQAAERYGKVIEEEKKFQTLHKGYYDHLDYFRKIGGLRLKSEALADTMILSGNSASRLCGNPTPDANNSYSALAAFVLLKGQHAIFGKLMKGFFSGMKAQEINTALASRLKAETAKGRAGGLGAGENKAGDPGASAALQEERDVEVEEGKDFQEAFGHALKSAGKHVLLETAVKMALTEVTLVEHAIEKVTRHKAHHVAHFAGLTVGAGLLGLDLYLRMSKIEGMDGLSYLAFGAKMLVLFSGFGALGIGAAEFSIVFAEEYIRYIQAMVPESRMKNYISWLQNSDDKTRALTSRQAAAAFSCYYRNGLNASPGMIHSIMPAEPKFFGRTIAEISKESEYQMISQCCDLGRQAR